MSEQRVVVVGQRGIGLARDLLALGHVVQHVPSCRRLWAGLPAGTWDACVLAIDQLTAHDANLIRHARESQPQLAVLLLADDGASAVSLARLTGADDVLVTSHPRATARRIADASARRLARLRTPTPAPTAEVASPAVYGAMAQRNLARLTDRVTHEIDNPATYVTANLTAVSEALAELAWDRRDQSDLSDRLDELDQMVRESLTGMARIRAMTQDLRTAARLEQTPDPDAWVRERSLAPGSLPASAPSPSSSQTRPRVETPPSSSGVGAAGPRLRLLLIDDEPMVLRALRRMLAQHSVVIANGGNEALSKLASRSDYDLIFCDLMMPDMDGTEVHDAIKRRFPHLLDRLVFFTGGALTSRTRAFIEQSTQPLVHKPMTRAAFAEISRRVLGKQRAPRASAEG